MAYEDTTRGWVRGRGRERERGGEKKAGDSTQIHRRMHIHTISHIHAHTNSPLTHIHTDKMSNNVNY